MFAACSPWTVESGELEAEPYTVLVRFKTQIYIFTDHSPLLRIGADE